MFPSGSQSGAAKDSPAASAADPISSLLGSQYVTTVSPNDVLLGRGSTVDNNMGNIQFRKIVRERKFAYSGTTDNKVKHQIACDVISTIVQKGGRFLRKIDSISDLAKLGLSPSVDLWIIVEGNAVMSKVKQALREKESTKSSHSKTSPAGRSQNDAALSSARLQASQSQQATILSEVVNDLPLPGNQQQRLSGGNMTLGSMQNSGRNVAGPCNSHDVPSVHSDGFQSLDTLRRIQNQGNMGTLDIGNAFQSAGQLTRLVDMETVRQLLSSNLHGSSQTASDLGSLINHNQSLLSLTSTDSPQNQHHPVMDVLQLPTQPNSVRPNLSPLDIFALTNGMLTNQQTAPPFDGEYRRTLVGESQTPSDLNRLLLLRQIAQRNALSNIQSTTSRTNFQQFPGTELSTNEAGLLSSQALPGLQALPANALNQESIARLSLSQLSPASQGLSFTPGSLLGNQLQGIDIFGAMPHNMAMGSQVPLGVSSRSSEPCLPRSTDIEDRNSGKSAESGTDSPKDEKRQASDSLDQESDGLSPDNKRLRKEN